MKTFIVSLLSFFLAFCAFNKSQNDITQRENQKAEEKNKLLRETYDIVTGLYQGQLHLNGEDRNVSLGIYTLEAKEGTNSGGEALFKPVLKAVYRQLFPIENPIVLDGRFVPETGELSFTNPTANLSNEVIHTINAHISNQKIIGLAKTLTGTLGTLELQFKQKHVEAPNAGDDQAIDQRLREQYALIAGTYVGKIKRTDNSANGAQNEWDIEVGIYTLEVKAGTSPSGETIFKPVLKAIFKQNFPIAPNVLLEAQYLPETGELRFLNSAAGADDLNTIDAKIEGNIIDGFAKKSTGSWGRLHLELVSKDVNTSPNSDENELNRKIREQYQKILGTYKGKIIKEISGNQTKQEWQVELALYILEVKSGTTPTGEPQFKPTLKALFKQLAPVVPNSILDAQYIAETGELVLSNNVAGTDQLNSITATINDQKINGSAQKTSGYWGKLQLQFVTKDVGTPGVGDEEDYNRRLLEEYQVLVGNYKGRINPAGSESFDVDVNIFIIQEPSGTITTPKLKAYYKRSADRYGASDLTMTINYRTELDPPAVDMSGERTNAGRTYFVVLNGRYKNGEIKGQYHDQRGYTGPFTLKFRGR